MEFLLSYLPNFMLQPLFWVLAWLGYFSLSSKQTPLRCDCSDYSRGFRPQWYFDT